MYARSAHVQVYSPYGKCYAKNLFDKIRSYTPLPTFVGSFLQEVFQ